MDPEARLRARMMEIKLDFIRGVPQHLDAMDAAFDTLNRAPEGEIDTEALSDLQRIVHTIAGTAGTFELTELTEIAAEMESVCKQVGGGTEITSGHRQELDRLREKLIEASQGLGQDLDQGLDLGID